MNDNVNGEVIRSATLDELRQMKERGVILSPDEIKDDVWDIKVLQEVTMRVVFDEPVTLEKAHQLFMNDQHQDVIDEVDQNLVAFIEPDGTLSYIETVSDEDLEEDD